MKLNFEEQQRQMVLDIEDRVYQCMLEVFSRGVRRDEQTRHGGGFPRWDNQPPTVFSFYFIRLSIVPWAL